MSNSRQKHKREKTICKQTHINTYLPHSNKLVGDPHSPRVTGNSQWRLAFVSLQSLFTCLVLISPKKLVELTQASVKNSKTENIRIPVPSTASYMINTWSHRDISYDR